ncbi:MAG: ATP-grasp domain-containing protein [Candidatus Thorarchaeota archaeon]
MTANKILFIFEYVSGGGFYPEDISSSLLCEGYAMLRCISEDFKNLGYRIITQLDERIKHLSNYLSVDEIYVVNSSNKFTDIYNLCLRKCNACFIIAPEFSNILYNLTKIAKERHKKVISIDLDGIMLGTSKIKTYDFFQKNNLNTPLTFLIPNIDNIFNFDFINEKFNEYHIPFIIKPDDGVGAESIYYFENFERLQRFFSNPDLNFNFNRNYILQEFIKGDDYSLSLINRDFKDNKKSNLYFISINSQKIKNKTELGNSTYFGGATPITKYPDLKNNIMKLIRALDLNQFNSYFGIDFIITDKNELFFIEINPRLTTSYVGIRNIYNQNLMSLLESQQNNANDFIKDYKFYSDFQKLDLLYQGNLTFDKLNHILIPELIKRIPELVTPPTCIKKSKNFQRLELSCFIATKSKNSSESKTRTFQIENILKKYQFEIIK